MDRGDDTVAALGHAVSYAEEDWRTYAELLSCWRDEEFSWLVKQLRFAGGNVSAVARRAKIDRRFIYRLLAKYSLDPRVYR